MSAGTVDELGWAAAKRLLTEAQGLSPFIVAAGVGIGAGIGVIGVGAGLRTAMLAATETSKASHRRNCMVGKRGRSPLKIETRWEEMEFTNLESMPNNNYREGY